MTDVRKESDSLGVVEVPADKLWGAQTQRSLLRRRIVLGLCSSWGLLAGQEM
jgi:fumarate hydratase class II